VHIFARVQQLARDGSRALSAEYDWVTCRSKHISPWEICERQCVEGLRM
jgi:hypothetical protein